MAQTTGGMSGSCAYVAYALDEVPTVVDISGYAASYSISGGEQITGSQQTFGGNTAIVTGSKKREPITVEFSIVYTDTDTEPFDALYDRFVGATPTAVVRFSPNGGASGDEQYTTTDDAYSGPILCPIVSCNPPDSDATSGAPRMFTFSVITPQLLKETIA